MSSCPFGSHRVVKFGFFSRRASGPRRVQRYLCQNCRRTFSDQTGALTYREKKPHHDQVLFRLICSGISQRRCAHILGVRQQTVASKIGKLATVARRELAVASPVNVAAVAFDEMETFEHSKCKPVSIALAVTEKERRVLAIQATQMPAKGRLVHISLKRYGYRKDLRHRALKHLLTRVRALSGNDVQLKSDECPRYPTAVRKFANGMSHITFKGRRGCVVGQGELKRGGHDPLFALNHTCAMFRDNLKRLSRRTWCTTKRIDRLDELLNLYACYHNQKLKGKNVRPRLGVSSTAN